MRITRLEVIAILLGLFVVSPACAKRAAVPASAKTQPAGKEIKGLVALAELVEKPGKEGFEVRLSLKNVTDKPITICDCVELMLQVRVQWTAPDGKPLESKHNQLPGSNFLLNKSHFVVIPPGLSFP